MVIPPVPRPVMKADHARLDRSGTRCRPFAKMPAHPVEKLRIPDEVELGHFRQALYPVFRATKAKEKQQPSGMKLKKIVCDDRQRGRLGAEFGNGLHCVYLRNR